MELIRRLAEASLVNGNDLKHFGVRPSRGLLLHGPPGTGKTMITRTIASAMRVPVLTINGPEIISKFVGETETKLRDLFQRARDNAPCIIFVDELDALCSTRTSATELENRIVATFLTLMDGLSEDGSHDSASIFVIGATNRPNSIDAALRRPGRFDREVLIGVPTPSARLDILKILLQDVPNSLSDAQLLQLASSTHGFVGADLAALCREAGLNTIQRCRQTSEQVYAPESSIMITMEDMLKSQLGIRPSAMREILLEVPKVRWSDIGGQADVKQKLKEAIEWPLKHPEAFERFGIRPPKGILLYGPPGCSKTLMAKAMATESGLNFMAVKGPELFSKWVGESERAVKEIFRRARAASPSIIFFDEIDAIAVRRGSGDASVGDRVLSQLLAEMDGIEQLTNVTIVAATNRPDILDSALLRPGRIDRILYIAPPDAASRLQILEMRLKVMACAENINLAQLVDWSDGFSGAECVSFCNEAAFKAMEECFDNPKVAMQHFEHARSTVQPQIGAEMLAFYKAFQERSGLRSV
ncbi:P-loop containing nucleoside triphosphate hydrolase protein [Phlyctochytrium arcticum]|nr:P-loop containing nucleoside triphosphate hydrolase protein [Phlyctochytrium arcticum]